MKYHYLSVSSVLLLMVFSGDISCLLMKVEWSTYKGNTCYYYLMPYINANSYFAVSSLIWHPASWWTVDRSTFWTVVCKRSCMWKIIFQLCNFNMKSMLFFYVISSQKSSLLLWDHSFTIPQWRMKLCFLLFIK